VDVNGVVIFVDGFWWALLRASRLSGLFQAETSKRNGIDVAWKPVTWYV